MNHDTGMFIRAHEQLMIELDDHHALNDAQYVAERLYTSTIGSVATSMDLMAREMGRDVQVYGNNI